MENVKQCKNWFSKINKHNNLFLGVKDEEGVSKEVQDTLCKLCKDNNCNDNSPYAGYNGAFQCMNESEGDVAFVKHDIPPKGSVDFELLCQDGSKKGETFSNKKILFNYCSGYNGHKM